MPPVRSRRAQYSEDTRAAVLDAALRRFVEHGFAATTLDEVAADIRATRGAVYHHFASKSALFEAVLDRVETETFDRVLAAGVRAGTPWEAMLAGVEVFLDRCCEPEYARIVWQEAPVALGWHRMRALEERYAYGVIAQTVRTLTDLGELPPYPVEPVARVMFHVFGAAGMALAEAAEPDKARIRGEYAGVITHILASVRSDGAAGGEGRHAAAD